MTTVPGLPAQSIFTPDVQRPPSESADAPTWNLARLVAFRFALIYFGLFVLTTQMLESLFPLPGLEVPVLGVLPPFRGLILWTGAHVFGISHPISYRGTGSGDKLFDWVQAGFVLLVTIVAVTVWTAVDGRRERHEKTYAWFRLLARFALGTTLLTYGLAKVVPLQMPAPFLSRLVQPFGSFSPMGVLWTSIGASRPYEIFAGSAECLAAILLFFPRTTTLGALVALADVIEVFMLNMSYDVPVKLFAFHLIVLSLVVLAPNIRQLGDMLLMHRPASLKPEPPLSRTPRRQRNIQITLTVFAAYVLAIGVRGSIKAWSQYGGGAPHSALYGIWDVEQMSMDGEAKLPLLTDSTRFQRAIFERPEYLTFYHMNGSQLVFGASIDTVAHTLALTTFGRTKATYPMTYERPAADRLIIDGTLLKHTLHLELTRRDPESFLVENRGFHFVSEFPFNR